MHTHRLEARNFTRALKRRFRSRDARQFSRVRVFLTLLHPARPMTHRRSDARRPPLIRYRVSLRWNLVVAHGTCQHSTRTIPQRYVRSNDTWALSISSLFLHVESFFFLKKLDASIIILDSCVQFSREDDRIGILQ